MKVEEFCRILVEEIVDQNNNNPSSFLKKNGIDPLNLNDKDEIWRLFVRYNLNTGNVKDTIVEKHWNKLLENSILKNRKVLLASVRGIKGYDCYENFTSKCPVSYKKNEGFTNVVCSDSMNLDSCPVMKVTEEIKWHRQHYKIAKIIVECAKRLLIEDAFGSIEGDLNSVILGTTSKYKDHPKAKMKITREIISKFDNMRNFGSPPKAIVWMLSDLCSPVHGLSHWPYFDLSQLSPVDTHVKRLMKRFGLLAANENIAEKLQELYPEEPRKLNLALYKLGAEAELKICRKTPDCGKCKTNLPRIYDACPSEEKKLSK